MWYNLENHVQNFIFNVAAANIDRSICYSAYQISVYRWIWLLNSKKVVAACSFPWLALLLLFICPMNPFCGDRNNLLCIFLSIYSSVVHSLSFLLFGKRRKNKDEICAFCVAWWCSDDGKLWCCTCTHKRIVSIFREWNFFSPNS